MILENVSIIDFSANIGGIDIDRNDFQGSVRIEHPEVQAFEVKGSTRMQYIANPHAKRIKATFSFMRTSSVRRDLILASETNSLGESGFIQLESGIRYLLTNIKLTEIGTETGAVATESSDAEDIVIMATGERA
jgi:hypothetical protein